MHTQAFTSISEGRIPGVTTKSCLPIDLASRNCIGVERERKKERKKERERERERDREREERERERERLFREREAHHCYD